MSKIIAVIGAQVPNFPYDSSMGFRVGHAIAKIMEKGDILLTGGVEGIGVDVFMGYAATPSKGTFACLIPLSTTIKRKGVKEPIIIPFSLPEAYTSISKITGKVIDVIQKGNDMWERREHLARMVDIAIVLNGGPGTLHEAEMILEKGKTVVSLPISGGVAELLAAYSYGDDKTIREFYGEGTLDKDIKWNIKNIQNVEFTTLNAVGEALKVVTA